jgi:hypothetical protein
LARVAGPIFESVPDSNLLAWLVLLVMLAIPVGIAVRARLWQRPQGIDRAALLCLPLLSAVALSALRLYPTFGRLFLFALPLGILLVLLGLGWLTAVGLRRVGRWLPVASRPVVAEILVPVALTLTIVVPLPGGAGVWAREDVASAARYLNKETSDSDTIYVDGSMVESFRYYQQHWPRLADRVLTSEFNWPCCPRLALKVSTERSVREEVARIRSGVGAGRVFLVFTRRKSHWRGYLRLPRAPQEVFAEQLVQQGCVEEPTEAFFRVDVMAFRCTSGAPREPPRPR